MNYILISIISCFLVSLISLIGAFFIFKKQIKIWFVRISVSFAIGSLLGVVLTHFFQEIKIFNKFIGLSVVLGILFFFILEKYLCWHHCHKTEHKNVKPIGLLNIIADGIHNIFDGFFITMSFSINFTTGLATTLAVILHEIPQEIADLGLIMYSGYSEKKALLLNYFSAITIFLGVVFAVILFDLFYKIKPFAIGFAAGNFLYLALVDLVPILKEESKKTLIDFLFIIIGFLIIFIL